MASPAPLWVAVDVASLKAGLRAHVRTQDLCAAFVAATNNYLPPELTDMVMEYAFSNLLSKFHKQWQIMYTCSGPYNLYLILGAVCHRWLQKRPQSLIEHIVQFVDTCSQCRSNVKSLDEEESNESKCEACHALMRATHQLRPVKCRNYGQFDDGQNYEDCVADINSSFDAHPDHGVLYRDIIDDDILSQHFVAAQKSLARDWYKTIESGQIFSPREVAALEAYGVQCKLRSNLSHDTIAFLMTDRQLKQKADSDLQSPRAVDVFTDKAIIDQVFKQLHLVPPPQSTFESTLRLLMLQTITIDNPPFRDF